MPRVTKWLLLALVAAFGPGCLGTGAPAEVGAHEAALSLSELQDGEGWEGVAAELATEDCAEAGRTASALGHDVVWAIVDHVGELALLEIDGILACATDTDDLNPGERAHIVMMRPIQKSRPDPEPADGGDESRPDPEPASPDASRPDPEPASPDESRPDPEPASPDESRPDPEPATGGTSGGCS